MLFNFNALDCLLYAVGKPVYHKFTDQNYGAWMRDPSPRQDMYMMMMKTDNSDKIWVTKENDTRTLYEYSNKVAFRTNNHTKKYTLAFPFKVLQGGFLS